MKTLILIGIILAGACFALFALVLVIGTISDYYGSRKVGRERTKLLDP